ncbi:putative helicase MOV-10 [Aquarana catesbeiana]|uniref:putative helicase MOV-10 n=1 Tax=Aquarana catesbeiana TaxID=8400 RepID=UPI003CC956E8
MPRKSLKAGVQSGNKFLQHLEKTDRLNITNKEELKTIYIEFQKTHNDLTNFSSTIYGLKMIGKAVKNGNKIQLFKDARVNSSLTDQWVAIRRGNEPMFIPPAQGGKSYSKPKARKIIQWLKSNRQAFICGKNGIQITTEHDITDGRIRFPLPPNEEKIFPISIKNTSNESVTFVQYKCLRRMGVFSFHDKHSVSASKTLLLSPGAVYDVQVRASTAFYGYFPVTLVFEFMKGNGETGDGFLIGRFISAVSNSKLAEHLAPTTRYVPYQRNLLKKVERIEVDGIPPIGSFSSELEREVPLGNFLLSSRLKHSIRAGMFSKEKMKTNSTPAYTQQRNLLLSALDFSNYSEKFHMLLHLEELQMEIDIRRYDRKEQKMQQHPRDRRLLILDVPGVAENRPSVLKGDHLFVSLSEEPETPEKVSYKGYVHGVELERVRLGFSHRLVNSFVDGMLFDVTFTFNRLPLMIHHRAVDLAEQKMLKDALFPTYSNRKCIVSTDKLSLYDRNLESNPEQYMAVKQIVSGISRPAPYLLFGPPGTGKTVTVVEAIKQVVKNIPNSHVLACAPSNSASDLLCQRLMKHIDKKDIYRLLASSRDFRSVPEDIKPCCNWNAGKEDYEYPSKHRLTQYRVIITTLVTAGRLTSANFPSGHFTHVFIDESGHAVEPESVTAVAGILDVIAGGQLVLAGDPKQLGPVLRSPIAIEHGLGISLLERLMTHNPLYGKATGAYNPEFVTKLLLNYRSHPDILTIPNELFYDNELQSRADQMVTHSYCNWEKLPEKGFPIIFHGVLGKDEREGNSPSFFNVAEIVVLMSYLKALLETQKKKGIAKISAKEIGIISPYRKQVEKIRKAVDKELKAVPDIKDLKVGSVEEFQGQERKVILISTVRSTRDYVKFDEEFSLGFLTNPKRFNVAITRAKALLILVGNPIILSKDPYWARFLKFCSEKGGSTGVQNDILDDINELEFAEIFKHLTVNEPPAGERSGESAVQQQAEPAWRFEH